MGDRTYAHFDVNLTTEQADNLLEMIDNREAKAADDAVMALYTAFSENYIDETDRYDSEKTSTVRLIKWEANYGDNAFDDFKSLCADHKIPYACYWNAGGDYGPGFVWWQPGWKGEIERSTNGEEIVVSHGQMTRFLHWFNTEGHKTGATLEQALSALYAEPGCTPEYVPDLGKGFPVALSLAILLQVNHAITQRIVTT